MALATSTIGEGRWGVEDIRNSNQVIASTVSEIRNVLQSNGDYLSFVEKTEVGARLNEKLETLLSSLEGNVVPAINGVSSKVQAFLDRQEQLNKEGR